MSSIDFKCKCGAISTFVSEEVGELKRCDKCLSSFMVPFESSPDTNLAPDNELEDRGEPSLRWTRAALTDNLPVEFGTSFPLAYEPSGAPGDMAKLVLGGFPAIGAGVAAGAACAGGALGLNALHNAIPYFIFLVPMVILGLLAISPAVFGWVTCLIVSKSVQDAKCRSPAVMGFVAFLWACGGIAFLTVAAQFSMPDGQYFLEDMVVPFVREMAADSLNFHYVENPDPVNLPSWAIYSILTGSALLGLFFAYGVAARKMCELPFCEKCERYMTKNTLWAVSPVHALKAVAAFLSLDYKGILELPYCDFRDNRIDVEVWECHCRSGYILELTGRATIPSPDGEEAPQKREPVRIFSRSLTLIELNRVRESGVTATA